MIVTVKRIVFIIAFSHSSVLFRGSTASQSIVIDLSVFVVITTLCHCFVVGVTFSIAVEAFPLLIPSIRFGT